MQDIGSINPLRQFQAKNQSWHRGMNENLIKMSMTIASSAISRTTPLPGSANEGDVYIEPGSGKIVMWVESFDDDGTPTAPDWWAATPTPGTVFYIRDENKWYLYSDLFEWTLLMALDDPYTPVARSLAFYAPGLVRAGATIFQFVPGMQLAIPQDAPGSGAGLEIAPSGGGIAFSIMHGSTLVGTINFAQDATVATIDFPNPVVVNNALPDENKYEQAQILRIVAPGDVRGASGLNVTIAAEIWERD